MSAMTPCQKDSPLMRKWENYNQSDEYANSFKWAAHEEHRKGSMWAAFMAGFLAANPMAHGENNEGDLKRERDEARESLENARELNKWLTVFLEHIRDNADIRYGKHRGLLAFSYLREEASRKWKEEMK